MRRRRDTIIDLTNPAGTPTSEVQDIELDTGYSLHFVVTGTLTFTSEIYAGNINDASKLSLLSGSAVAVSSSGYINNTSLAQYDYFYVKLSAIAGTGTVKCIRTIKEV